MSYSDERKILRMSPEVCILLGAVTLGICVIILAGIAGGGELVQKLADHEVARGLITFVVSVGTVGIALLLALAALLGTSGADSGARFTRAKDVLVLLVGVLGTIVGFYFGTTVQKPPTNGEAQPAVTDSELKTEADPPPVTVEPPVVE